MMLTGKVFVTGGTGSLGRALLTRAQQEKWSAQFTVYSRDEMKQQALKRQFPFVRLAIGDVADYDTLERAMVGHDTVLHLAAFKHIPAGESNVAAMLQTNLVGTQNVASATLRSGVERVLFVSTDKACHPVNAYGASKMLGERVCQEADALGLTEFHLVRYGNVLSSTGSVIPLWKEQVERGEPLRVTEPSMTRFWLTEQQAVDCLLAALNEPHGCIYVPRLPSLSMGLFQKYLFPDAEYKEMGLRPGEKMHEELLTREETRFTENYDSYFRLHPVAGPAVVEPESDGYTSDNAPRLARHELLQMVGWSGPFTTRAVA